MDADHLAIDKLYQALKTERVPNILPLIVNVTDPSPNLGWRNMERKRIDERGRPDLVLALALIHHVVIGGNIPMAEFVQWLRDLGGDLVIEFVTRKDPMVVTLLRNKEDHYTDYDEQVFERELARAVRHRQARNPSDRARASCITPDDHDLRGCRHQRNLSARRSRYTLQNAAGRHVAQLRLDCRADRREAVRSFPRPPRAATNVEPDEAV